MQFAGDYQTQKRMTKKLEVVPLPDLRGKTLLDVGCDHGFWSFLAAERGASDVLGLDRNRPVNGQHTDLIARNRGQGVANTRFEHIELGLEWRRFGHFDVVLLLSLYHHVYNLTGDHHPIWYWLWLHTGETLLWENPTDLSDGVAAKDIRGALHAGYTPEAIRKAAEAYFDIEVVGPGHVASRVVWRCTPKDLPVVSLRAQVRGGMGGASKAFERDGNQRIKGIHQALGEAVVPGTLNLNLSVPFDWNSRYFVADVFELLDRKDEAGAMAPRRCRFYPIDVDCRPAYAMRFENEKYRDTFMEVIATESLRTALGLKDFCNVTVTCAS